MQVLGSLEEAGRVGRPLVVSAGNFDGVHRAHRAILAGVQADALRRGLGACALTFEPHPNRILRPQAAPRLITPLPEKIRRLAATGLDYLLVLPFTRDLSLLSPLEFVEQVLVRGLRIAAIHEGENFRFGHRHAGDVAELRRLGAEFGFAVEVVPPVRIGGEIVSSSRIRSLVEAGDMARARHLLGWTFAVRAGIARGRGVGRRETVPTLNLQRYDELLPRTGVYLTRTCLELDQSVRAGAWYNSVTNVGVRPTFGPDGELTVESHLLAPPGQAQPLLLEGALGEHMEIAFLRRLRDEMRFDSAAALQARIQRDLAVAHRFFARLGP